MSNYAESVGICVGNVAYSPDSVADYTLMLMLMAVRNAKSIIRRADAHDYRLHDVRGKELRDLTVGVIGTGRIGAAVMDRLRGFGCRILAYDSHPKTAADYVPLDELLQLSDIVTLHTPLNADTHHLLNRRRIEQMKHGAFIINTGRGSLLDTEALISAIGERPTGRCGAGRPRRRGRNLLRRLQQARPSRASRCCGCKSCRTCLSVRTPPTTQTTP